MIAQRFDAVPLQIAKLSLSQQFLKSKKRGVPTRECTVFLVWDRQMDRIGSVKER